jgi:hypothetical protein
MRKLIIIKNYLYWVYYSMNGLFRAKNIFSKNRELFIRPPPFLKGEGGLPAEEAGWGFFCF